MSMDYEREVKRGVSAVLAEETYLAWIDPDAEPQAAYGPGDVGLYDGVLPSEPATAVMLNTYTVAMHPVPIIGVQFHVAALDPDEMTRAVQAISDTLEGRWGGTLGSVRLVTAAWQSGTPLGQDANGRRGRTDNYYLTISRTIPRR
jgi:hypothetical protein